MFYVYELIDPRNGEVFYVGKGQADRVGDHLRDALAGRIGNKAKHEAIMDIVSAGLRPIESVIANFEDEDDALSAEAERIAFHGLESLTNMKAAGVRSFNALRFALEVAQRIRTCALRDIRHSRNAALVEFQRDFLVIADQLIGKASRLRESK